MKPFNFLFIAVMIIVLGHFSQGRRNILTLKFGAAAPIRWLDFNIISPPMQFGTSVFQQAHTSRSSIVFVGETVNTMDKVTY